MLVSEILALHLSLNRGIRREIYIMYSFPPWPNFRVKNPPIFYHGERTTGKIQLLEHHQFCIPSPPFSLERSSL